MGEGKPMMKAMRLERVHDLRKETQPLDLVACPCPEPGFGDVRIKVSVCGVCHTELDEIEGRMPPPSFPVIPGHQSVGRVDRLGPGVSALGIGDRVGVA